MEIYFLLFAILGIFAIATWNAEFAPLFLIGCFAYFLLVGLRSPEVGADTKAYVDYYLNPGAGYGSETRALESGYSAWNSFLGIFGFGSPFFILSTALVSLIGTFYFLWHNATYRSMSLLYLALIPDILRLPLGTLRQAIAVSIFLIGFHLYQTNSKRLYSILLFLVAWSFHKSILLPVVTTILLGSINVSVPLLWGTLLISIPMCLSDSLNFREIFRALTSQLSLLGLDRLSGYSDFRAEDWYVDTKSRIFLMAPGTVMGFFILWKQTRNSKPSLIDSSSIIGISFFNLTLSYPMAGRSAAIYFIIASVAFVNAAGRRGILAIATYIILALFYLRFSYYAFKMDQQGITEIMICPYKINPELWR